MGRDEQCGCGPDVMGALNPGIQKKGKAKNDQGSESLKSER